MSEQINLQDAILKEVQKDRVPITLFLMNGFQLRGIITGFDSFVVVLVTDGKQQMIQIQTCHLHLSPYPASESRSTALS